MGNSQKLQMRSSISLLDCVPLDVTFLNLTTFGDLTLRTEIINLFLAQLETVQARLQLPMDAKSWAYLTHTLKGAAAAVGARQLAALADHWGHSPHPATVSDRQAIGAEIKRAAAAFNNVVATLVT